MRFWLFTLGYTTGAFHWPYLLALILAGLTVLARYLWREYK